ncbi:hypothetical protein BOTBODRAFT_57574 [Botryobasidium botryosum FD-172 SS1]|uniref:HTH La-type RNA-binding domain-containing protein n=1 Tax=Botryobasidium botryosum (strain FD-172 SS1) TaxID=930990 RepID=A0A067MH82_BOTB1|nr:hypothetical protein BOTBODRAFT_57574 [Botryobasidium botryosum FD-172 SS1]
MSENPADNDCASRALKQVEFYFSDSNLPFDKFLWSQHIACTENWVPIKIIASFKNMRQFRDLGLVWLADVLRTSESLLEVDPRGENVRRKTPVVETDICERSAYLEGFGEEESEGLFDQIHQFFTRYGTVLSLRLLRTPERKFKGAVLCEFANKDSVRMLMRRNPRWNDEPLLVMQKDEYVFDQRRFERRPHCGSNERAAYRAVGAGQDLNGFNAFREIALEKKLKATSQSDEEKALRQVEYCFSDAYLPYNPFIWHLRLERQGYWVPIKRIASLKCMREFELRSHYWLAKVLRESKELLEVDERGECVRRATPMTGLQGQMRRTVYAKGFGIETDELYSELYTYFSQQGEVIAVDMRRAENGAFKGSVYCEFSSVHSVDTILARTPPLTWRKERLLIMPKEDYCRMKILSYEIDSQTKLEDFAWSEKIAIPDRRFLSAFQR